MWANPNVPNLPDYILFVSGTMGINTVYLPVDSPFLEYAFNRALGRVFNNASGPYQGWAVAPPVGGIEYTLAVYNCAGHIQIMISPDQVGPDGTSYDYFNKMREDGKLLHQSVGLTAASSDQGTAFTYAVSDAMRQLTISDLDFMTTWWGRQYLAYAQDFGPPTYGLS
jgi:hypothetical protein